MNFILEFFKAIPLALLLFLVLFPLLFTAKTLINIFSNDLAKKIRLKTIFLYTVLLFIIVITLVRVNFYNTKRILGHQMTPTLLDQDFILYKVLKPNEVIHRGEIIIWEDPITTRSRVGRVIGLPGDNIKFSKYDGFIEINNKKQIQEFWGNDFIYFQNKRFVVKIYKEYLENTSYYVTKSPSIAYLKENLAQLSILVPEGNMLVFLDDRSNTSPTLVALNQVSGVVKYIFLSWDSTLHDFRWNRIGQLNR